MVPNSEIWLCKNTKLRKGSEDTYYFANETARLNFFLSKSSGSLHFSALSYQRDNKSAKLPVSYIDACLCDYMVFTNTGYSGKYWYAFITKVNYVNDEVSEVEFEIDPMQTWFPSLTLNKCYVSRETPSSDGVYANIQPEPDLGGELYTFKTDALGEASSASTWLDYTTVQAGYVAIAVKRVVVATGSEHTDRFYSNNIAFEPTEDMPTHSSGTFHITSATVPLDNGRGVACSYAYYVFPRTADGFKACATMLNDYVVYPGASSDDVVGGFMCPGCALPQSLIQDLQIQAVGSDSVFLVCGETLYTALQGVALTGSSSYNKLQIYKIPTTPTFVASNFDTYVNTTSGIFGGYVPKNAKLWNAPYFQITLDNGTGDQQTFSPERFSGWSAEARFYPLLDSTVQVACAVDGYNGDDRLFHILTLDSYPTFSWNSNSMSEWSALFGSYQAQKTAMANVSAAISGAAGIASGAMTVAADPVGGAARAAGALGNMVGSIYANNLEYNQTVTVARNASPKSHGTTRGNLVRTQLGKDYITVLYRSLKAADAEKVDNYFTKYGYAINKIKSLEFGARSRFYYVKTGDFNCSSSNVPGSAVEEIAARFQAGVRLWKGDYLGDYSVANTI